MHVCYMAMNIHEALARKLLPNRKYYQHKKNLTILLEKYLMHSFIKLRLHKDWQRVFDPIWTLTYKSDKFMWWKYSVIIQYNGWQPAASTLKSLEPIHRRNFMNFSWLACNNGKFALNVFLVLFNYNSKSILARSQGLHKEFYEQSENNLFDTFMQKNKHYSSFCQS